MNILFGRHKGRRLRTPPDGSIRPTTGRVRDWLGNVLRERLPGAAVLDLYAGSGGLGLLALSMGASHVTFVDKAPAAIRLIEQNLQLLKEEAAGLAIRQDVESFLKRQAGRKWPIVFVDPPYESTDFARLMTALALADILTEDGVLVVEHPAHQRPAAPGLILLRNKAFGRSTISFYQNQTQPGDGSPGTHRPH